MGSNKPHSKKPRSKKTKNTRQLPIPLLDEISQFLFALGNQFVRVSNSQGAFDCFKYSVDLWPTNANAVFNLGTLYDHMGNFEGALKMYQEACRMDQSFAMAKIATAEVLRKLGRLREAQEAIQPILDKYPDSREAISCQAILYYDKGEIAEALEWNDKALQVTPNDQTLFLNKALLNMLYGDWDKWWSVYETCLSYGKHNSKMRTLRQADAWQGQACEGKVLLVVSDQGAGDALQFGRFIGKAKEVGKFAKVTYVVPPDMMSIIARIPGVDEVVGFGDKPKIPRDEFSPLLGIMRILRVSPKDCIDVPRIGTDPQRDELWKARIDAAWDGKSKKVGIVWAGDPRHGNDHNRSMKLSDMLPWGKIDGVQLFSLQVGEKANQLSVLDELDAPVELGTMLRDYDDTASALKSLDLLITVDTSALHLAGCIGTQAWGCLPLVPEWRHLLHAVDSPWYETVQYFRQAKFKDWTNVTEAIGSRLEEWVKNG